MGLDVCFELEPAIKAGLILDRKRNGDQEAIDRQEEHYLNLTNSSSADWCIEQEKEHLDWLLEMQDVCRVPNGDGYWRDIWKAPDGTGHVRANKWGDFYAPLTEFLKKNGIEWDEY